MSEFQYESGGATAEADLPNEGWATGGFAPGLPIEGDMKIPLYPWEAPPMFPAEPSVAIAPPNVLVITAPPRRVKEAAHEYVNRIQASLPERVRESFTSGAGMFDFPAPPDVDDHLAR